MLAATARPVDADAVAAAFTGRGAWQRRVPPFLDALAALGRAPAMSGLWPAGRQLGAASPARILTGYYFRGGAVETTTMTSKGQVTIPKAVRQRLGLRRGTKIAVVVEGDHAVLRPAVPPRAAPRSGFGMVQVKGAAVPPDFDVASLLAPKAAAKRGATR